MPRTTTKYLGAILAFVFAAGCSAGSQSGPGSLPLTPGTADGPNAATQNHKARAKARFEIRVPRRRAHYVSPNTQSMTIAVNGATPKAFNLTPGSPGCSTSGGATQCSFALGIPSGTDTFAVETFGGTLGSGSLLSRGSSTRAVAVGALAVIPVTLQGIVGSITVTLGTSAPPAGTAFSTPVYVTAFDASGAMIAGPGTYNVPITLTDSDATGVTTVSSTPITGPGGSGTLSYTGASLSNATIGATASGIATVTSATFAPTPSIVASFTLPAGLGNNTAAFAIAAGPDGNVWYTTYGVSAAIVRLTPSGIATPFIAGVTANLAGGAMFNGITTGPDGNLWFTDNANNLVGKITPSGVVTEYAAPGSICPNRIVTGPPGDGGLWFTSSCSASIGHITTLGTAVESPLTGFGPVFQGILVGKDHNVYITDLTQQALGQLQVSGGALTSYSEFKVGTNPIDGTVDTKIYGLSQTADGQLWFTNQGCVPSTIGSVQIGTPFSSSMVKQFVTKMGCSLPMFLTPSADGSELFLALWNYPVIETLTPTGIGGAPIQGIYAIQTSTPNSIQQGMWDVTLGPNGNVWATNNHLSGNDPSNVIEMAY